MEIDQIPKELGLHERRIRELEREIEALKEQMSNRLYNCKQAAAELGISVNTLRKYRQQGEIFPVLGCENLYSIQSIKDFLDRRARGC